MMNLLRFRLLLSVSAVGALSCTQILGFDENLTLGKGGSATGANGGGGLGGNGGTVNGAGGIPSVGGMGGTGGVGEIGGMGGFGGTGGIGGISGTGGAGGNCQPMCPTCTDGMENGTETDVDCGGMSCPPCDVDKKCMVDMDCLNGTCSPATKKCN